MGYELNRIMNQYGVSTPGIVNYSGTAAPLVPTAPTVTRATGEDAAARAAQTTYDKQLADFNAYTEDPTAFNETMRKYGLDKTSYDTYRSDYQNRMRNTPMYAQAQFQKASQPVANTVADLYKMYLGRDPEAGVDGSASANTRPNFIQEAQRELSSMPNFGNQNLMNATGSYYGNRLKMPTFLGSSTEYTPPPVLPGVIDNSLSAKNTTDQYIFDPVTNTRIYNPYYIAKTGGNAPGAATGGDAPGDAPGEGTIGAAAGGRVKTHYQTAGAVRLPSGYESIEDEEDFASRFFPPSSDVVVNPVNMDTPSGTFVNEPQAAMPVPATVITDAPTSVLTNIKDADVVNNIPIVSKSVPNEPAVIAIPKITLPFGGERIAGIQALLAAYGPKDSTYAVELKTARDRATADSEAFTKMLTSSMTSPEDAQGSKAEMYFRLAAAFGAPTKTGQFSENLGMVGKELGEYVKGKRASAREKQLLGLEVQKLKMASSKEDLNTLRTLSAEEMRDKRVIATELIKDYIKSGDPQSTAGKQALDEGLKPGTKEYQDRVAVIGNLNVEGKLAQINASLAGMSTQAAMLALAQNKFEQTKDQQSKLTGPEIKMKEEASQALVTMRDAYNDLNKALELNQNAFDGSLVDQAQYKLLSSAGSKDPKVVNTGVLDNLLKLGALSTAATTLKTQISDADIKMLNQIQGSGAKSKQERAAILEAAKVRMKNMYMEKKAKLAEINRGAYRDSTSTSGELD